MDIARELEKKWATMLEALGLPDLAKEMSKAALHGAVARLPATLDAYGAGVYAERNPSKVHAFDGGQNEARAAICRDILQRHEASEQVFAEIWKLVYDAAGSTHSAEFKWSAQLHRRVALLCSLYAVNGWWAVKTAVPEHRWDSLRAIALALQEMGALVNAAASYKLHATFFQVAFFAAAGLM